MRVCNNAESLSPVPTGGLRAKSIHLVGLFCMFLALPGHAAAPVVDDSDNFAVFDEQAASSPASAGRRAVNQEEEPLAKVIPEDKNQNLSLPAQVRALQQEVQSLRGELEVQAHTIEQLKQQQLSFYKDMDARLHGATSSPPKPTLEVGAPSTNALPKGTTTEPTTEIKTSTPVSTPTPSIQSTVPVSSGTPSNPADEQIAYLAAYDLVKAKRYNEALSAMQTFVKQYPRGGYTANAEYWTGELYLAKNLPAQAMQHFENVLNQFPTSSKAAASALKIGYALSAMGHREEAKMRLKEVIKNYPDTTAAQLAKTKLEGM